MSVAHRDDLKFVPQDDFFLVSFYFKFGIDHPY